MAFAYKPIGRICLALLLAVFSNGVVPASIVHAASDKHNNDAGDIKVRELGAADEIPQNNPHLGSCSVVVEFYNFNNKTTDQQASVTFTPKAPTASATITVSGDSLTPTLPADGGNDGTGNNDDDGAFTYTLSFEGQPQAQQGYHVDLDVVVSGSNGASKSKTFWMPASCQHKLSATPEAPTQVDNCGVEQDSYTLPTTTGVIYTVDDQRVNGVGDVVVTASAADGYVLADGSETSWTLTFTEDECEQEPIVVTPNSPTHVDMCGTGHDTYTIPETEGVTYYIGQQAVQAGTYAGSGAVTITAVADQGYQLDEEADSQWTFNFSEEPCPHAHITVTTRCSLTGVEVILTNDGNADGRATVNGNTVTVAAGTTVKVTLPVDPDFSAHVEVKIGKRLVYCQTVDCTPGEGGGTPVTPPVTPTPTPTPSPAPVLPAELPATGPTDTSYLLMLPAMIVSYGAVYFVRNRYALSSRRTRLY